MATFLLTPARERLNHQSAQFTWESIVELMCDEKQRNSENLNFKSAASAAVILAQILAQSAVLASHCLVKLPQTLPDLHKPPNGPEMIKEAAAF